MKFVALLRGINVGGRVVKMTDLVDCFEKAGLRSVKTVLQSGNVGFESDKSRDQLKALTESALTKRFNYPAKAQIRSEKDLQQIVHDYPFKPYEQKQDYVIFIESGLEQDLAKEPSDVGEQVKVGKGVVYWQVDKGQTLKSSFALHLTKGKYREHHTNRNLKTLQKILAQSV